MYDVFLYAHKDTRGNDAYYMEYDDSPSEAQPLLPMLKRFVLRSKVRITDVSDEWDVWAAWGTQTAQIDSQRQWRWAGHSGVAEPIWSNAAAPWGSNDLEVQDMRAPAMGRRFLVRKGDTRASSLHHPRLF